MKLSNNKNNYAWPLGILMFLLYLNTVYALLQLVLYGPYTEINLLSIVGGALNVSVLFYFVTSMLIAGAAFGYFSSFITHKSTETESAKIVGFLETRMDNNAGDIKEALSKEMARFSLDQFKTSNEVKNIKTQLTESQQKIEKTIEACEKHGQDLKKQNNILNEVETKIRKIELQLTPKTCLASVSNIKAVSGIGRKKAENLKAIGITTVEDFITGNTAFIAQKTGISESTVAKMQEAAQLFLIPGLSSKTAKLLQKAEITSMDDLASQNPLELFKKIASIAKKTEDRPTLEEIASYIAFARYNSGQIWYSPTIAVVPFSKEIVPS